jgi:hypothetical protein
MDYLILGSFVLEREAQPKRRLERPTTLQPD